jgi:hypothetical protein
MGELTDHYISWQNLYPTHGMTLIVNYPKQLKMAKESYYNELTKQVTETNMLLFLCTCSMPIDRKKDANLFFILFKILNN